MTAAIKSKTPSSATLEMTVPLAPSMLQSEEHITAALNEAGSLAAETALKPFDTRGLGDCLWQGEVDRQGRLPQNLSNPLGRGQRRAPRLSKFKRRPPVLPPGATGPDCPHRDPRVGQTGLLEIRRARLQSGMGRLRTKPSTHHRTRLSQKALRCGGGGRPGERGGLGLCSAGATRTGEKRERGPRWHLYAADRKRLARGQGGYDKPL